MRRAGSAEAIDLDLAQVAWRAPPPPPPKYEWDAAADAALAEAFGLAAEADKLAKEWHKMGMPPELGGAVAPPAGGADDQGQKDLAGVVQKLFPKTWMTKVRVQKRWDLLRAQQKKEEDEQKKAEREQRAERAAAADAAAAPQGDALVGQTVEVQWDGFVMLRGGGPRLRRELRPALRALRRRRRRADEALSLGRLPPAVAAGERVGGVRSGDGMRRRRASRRARRR